MSEIRENHVGRYNFSIFELPTFIMTLMVMKKKTNQLKKSENLNKFQFTFIPIQLVKSTAAI